MSTAALLANAPEFIKEQEQFFENEIRPVLVKRCFSCHGEKKQFAELRLDSLKGMLKGGETGPAIVPGHPEKSLLVESINRESFEMPPEEELPEEEIILLTKWIKAGAYWPETTEETNHDKQRSFINHWAFQPVSNPAIPEVNNKDWPLNPIDHFVLRKLEENQLTPSPPADQITLRRRIKWDLVGLPLSQREVDYSNSVLEEMAINEIIEQYLSSEHYGERWGRYWLDIARYADTKGYVFFEKPTFHNGYTYRDYVIQSFNKDKPYNQFLLEQIAADQLENVPHEAQAALGFITIGARFKNDIHDIMADRIDVVSRGLLGLTVGCARCHDHKYDPVSIEDYYSFYGIFRNSVMPLHLPFRSAGKIPDSLKEKSTRIENAANSLDQHLRDKYVRMMKDGEERLGEYLKVAQSKRSGPNTVMFDVIVDGDDLSPELLLIWQRFLNDSQKKQSPMFRLWNALAAIPPEDFSAQSKIVLNSQQAEKNEPINRYLTDKLLAEELNSFDDVITVYEREIKIAQQEWFTLNAKSRNKSSTTLADPDKEELRKVISGKNSPLKVPYHYFRVSGLFPDRKSQKTVNNLHEKLDKLRSNNAPELAQMLVLRDAEEIIEPRVFKRGNANRPGQSVPRKYLRFFNQVSSDNFSKGSGRLELAEAIVSPDNPLTARVIVNRVWQKHFGQGLVRTVSDFGLQSEKPSHLQLLDHLAHWFMNHNWSIKSLHRYIMQSATYQQQVRHNEKHFQVDPENRLLWRMNRRRQDFETLRDSLLAVSDQLDRTVGGPSVKNSMSDKNKRRTLYSHIDRQNLPGIYRTFDFPPPDVSSGSRSSTSVPGQALFLMNHPFVLQCAKEISDQSEKIKDLEQRIQWLYQKILARNPSENELEEIISFLDENQNAQKQTTFKNLWKYGYGAYELDKETLTSFQEIHHWTGSQLQAGPAYPDSKLGWISLNSRGGHPGNDINHAAVIRWVAPEDLTVSVSGTLKHEKQKGNGIRARILVSGKKVSGPWSVHQNHVLTKLDDLEVKKGEAIDFVVDINDHLGFDSFAWAPVIQKVSGTRKVTANSGLTKEQEGDAIQDAWGYQKDFRATNRIYVTNWMNIVQALLISNEFQFID